MKIEYIKRSFAQSTLDTISLCNSIINDYADQGFSLTVRQLYYRLVAQDSIENSQKEYKRIVSIVNNARLAGLVDWYAIEDRTRFLRGNSHWDNPLSIMKSAKQSFALDRWNNQEYRPEVWIEKDALIGIISGICSELDVPYFSCRGYTSQSEMWRAAMRAKRYISNSQVPYIIHLGDHDPSGVDMTRDIIERMELLVGRYVDVERIALNWGQIEKHKPPPNFTKVADSRAKVYIASHGNDSWELDALEPGTIVDLIQDAIFSIRDVDALEEIIAREEQMLSVLSRAVEFVKSLQ